MYKEEDSGRETTANMFPEDMILPGYHIWIWLCTYGYINLNAHAYVQKGEHKSI